MQPEKSQRALDGVLVLSVGHTLPGLYCLAILRDLGARVIRIERLAQKNSAAENSSRENSTQEKYKGMDVTFPIRSLTLGTDELQLNLKNEQGIAVFRKLAERADVVLEGFRPGVMRKLGIDYAALSSVNAKLIYAAITSYGQTGEYKDRPGHDINYLAETGILNLTNPIGLPGATYGDGMAGVCAALNIVAALHARVQSGKGQMIDCAIVDGPLSLMTSEFEYYWNTGESRTTGANHLTGSHPWYGVYRTRDGEHVAIGAVEPQFYQTLCHALGLPELAAQQYAEGKAAEAARSKITAAIAARTRAEVLALFNDHQACVSPVAHTDEVLVSPLAARAVATDASGTRYVQSPVRLDSTGKPGSCTPALLANLLQTQAGFTKNEIEQLVAQGIMASL